MKTIIDSEHQVSVLAQWRGARAKLWMFHVTHNKLAIRLAKPHEPEVIYIVAIGCEHLVGPFSWEKANISIDTAPANDVGEVVCYVRDREAAFELRCSSATVVRGPATDFDETFDNFLGDS